MATNTDQRRLACNKEADNGGNQGPRRCIRAPGHDGKHVYRETTPSGKHCLPDLPREVRALEPGIARSETARPDEPKLAVESVRRTRGGGFELKGRGLQHFAHALMDSYAGKGGRS